MLKLSGINLHLFHVTFPLTFTWTHREYAKVIQGTLMLYWSWEPWQLFCNAVIFTADSDKKKLLGVRRWQNTLFSWNSVLFLIPPRCRLFDPGRYSHHTPRIYKIFLCLHQKYLPWNVFSWFESRSLCLCIKCMNVNTQKINQIFQVNRKKSFWILCTAEDKWTFSLDKLELFGRATTSNS